MNLEILLDTLLLIDINNEKTLKRLTNYIALFIKENGLKEEVLYKWLKANDIEQSKLISLFKSLVNKNAISAIEDIHLLKQLIYILYSEDRDLVFAISVLLITTENKEYIRLLLLSNNDSSSIPCLKTIIVIYKMLVPGYGLI